MCVCVCGEKRKVDKRRGEKEMVLVRGRPLSASSVQGCEVRAGGSSKVLVRPCVRAPSYGSACAHALRRGRRHAHAVRTYAHA